MTKLEKAVKLLFTNSSHKHVIENLKGENWSKFSSAKRLATLQDIENIIAEICEREPITLGVSDPYNTLIGVTQPGNVSNKIIEGKDTPYSFIRNHFYELRIAEIFLTIENENAENEVPENLYKIWEKNNSFSWFNEEEGCFLKEDHPDFNYQPIIANAHDFSNAAVKEVIKSVYRHGGLDNYIESFYINDLPRYRAYENKTRQDKVLKEIVEKDELYESQIDELLEFYINEETKVEDAHTALLHFALIPALSQFYEAEFNEEIIEELVYRELASYGITRNIDFEYIDGTNLNNCVYNITSNIVDNIHLVDRDKLPAGLIEEIIANKNETPHNLIDQTIAPTARLLKYIYHDLKDKVCTTITTYSDNPLYIEEIDKFDKMYADSFERVIEEYYGLEFDDYYHKLVSSLKNRRSENFYVRPKKDNEFENELIGEVLKIASDLHSRNHKYLTPQHESDVFNKLEAKISEYYGVEPVKIVINESSENMIQKNFSEKGEILGGYLGMPGGGVILLEKKKDDTQYRLLNSYIHEKRHHLQQAAMEGKVDYKKLGLSKNELDLISINYKTHGYLAISNYVNDKIDEYVAQPLERDAYRWSNKLTFELIKNIEELKGKDAAIPEFLFEIASGCPYTQLSEAELEKAFTKTVERWKVNLKQINNFEERYAKLEDNMANLSVLSDDDFYYYFNEYIFANFSEREKKAILSELDRRECKYSKRERTDFDDPRYDTLIMGNASEALEIYYKDTFRRIIEEGIKTMPDSNDEVSQGFKKFVQPGYDKSILNKNDQVNLYESQFLDEKLNQIKAAATDNFAGGVDPHYELIWNGIIAKYDYEANIKEIKELLNQKLEKDKTVNNQSNLNR